jgi:hypothetical protein
MHMKTDDYLTSRLDEPSFSLKAVSVSVSLYPSLPINLSLSLSLSLKISTKTSPRSKKTPVVSKVRRTAETGSRSSDDRHPPLIGRTFFQRLWSYASLHRDKVQFKGDAVVFVEGLPTCLAKNAVAFKKQMREHYNKALKDDIDAALNIVNLKEFRDSQLTRPLREWYLRQQDLLGLLPPKPPGR